MFRTTTIAGRLTAAPTLRETPRARRSRRCAWPSTTTGSARRARASSTSASGRRGAELAAEHLVRGQQVTAEDLVRVDAYLKDGTLHVG